MQTAVLSSALYPKRWIALALLCTAQFLVIMDTSIIGIALPAIKNDLGYTQEGLQWIFNAYVIIFGGSLLLGGRLSDLLGARSVFMWGFFLLAVASVFAGSAWSPESLNFARGFQGFGSALIAPAAMTILMGTFTDPKELGKAFGFWGASAAAGGSAGVFLGGVITEWFDWRWVFLINVPVALVVLLTAKDNLLKGTKNKGSIDWTGAVLSTLALVLLVYTIVSGDSYGWLSVHTIGFGILAVGLFIVFIWTQKRKRQPLLPLRIFKTPNLASGNILMGLLAGAWIPMWFFLNLYLQQILQLNAFYSGVALLPMTTVIMIVMVGLTGKLVSLYGFKPNLIAGLVLLSAALLLLSNTSTNGGFWGSVLLPSIIGALGMSLAYIPGTMASMSAAKPEEMGLASGIVNTSYQIGSAIGLAVSSVIAISITKGAQMKGVALVQSLNEGFRGAFITAAILSLVAVIIAVSKIKQPKG
jgi:EmrB/QacA subfamily drug resistance transporter